MPPPVTVPRGVGQKSKTFERANPHSPAFGDFFPYE